MKHEGWTVTYHRVILPRWQGLIAHLHYAVPGSGYTATIYTRAGTFLLYHN